MTVGRTLLALFALAHLLGGGAAAAVRVDPPTLRLQGPGTRYTLLVSVDSPEGMPLDRSGDAHYRSLRPEVVRVNGQGVVEAVGDGAATIAVEVEGRTLSVAVTVEGTKQPRRLSFAADVEPVLNRFGCNSSGCHGKAEGQNGFKLSVFGFDPAADHDALTREARGRRIFPAAAEHSLLLRKATGRMPHGGGARIRPGSWAYDVLRSWIEAGAPFGAGNDPGIVAVRVEPRQRVLTARGRQQLRVLARCRDGREMDVTEQARFQSNHEGLATVSPEGVVQAGDVPGEAAVMVSFRNAVDTFRLTVPRSPRIDPYPELAANSFVDTLVFRRLRRLNVLPSEPADDATYLRRVYLDVIGTLPTPAEARRFLADTRPDRRARLVEELLLRPEFADFWALQWADLLRVDRAALGPRLAQRSQRWLHGHFAAGRPLDELARAVLTAEGPLNEAAPASFYKAASKPGEAASGLAQVFLGVRIGCAQCHHHPFDRWSQDDYHGLTAFFSGLHITATPLGEALSWEGMPSAVNPRTQQVLLAHPLGEPAPAHLAAADPRRQLADWMTSPRNPWFARNLANRVWAHFLGRGLVEPVDDVRDTNPPSNPELLDALAAHLAEHHFDLRSLIRLITASRVYQLSATPNASNERDEQGCSRARFRRPSAEVLLDMISQTTGVPERFSGMPPGTRAIQLWDSKTPHYFLKVFGRPERTSTCACERNGEPSVAGVLHLLNSPEIAARLSHEGGTIARLVKRQPADEPLVEELYLLFYSRLPDARERRTALGHLRQARDRRQAVEDLAWSLLNSLEFVFNH